MFDLYHAIIILGTCEMPSMNSDIISWSYNSTRRLMILFWCNESPDEVFSAMCNEEGIWSPNPANDSILLCNNSYSSYHSMF